MTAAAPTTARDRFLKLLKDDILQLIWPRWISASIASSTTVAAKSTPSSTANCPRRSTPH
jgi:hypothetical protein